MSLIVKLAESSQELSAAHAIRLQVFVQEQGVPMDLELDVQDATAHHAVAVQDGSIVGTGRLVLDTPGHGIIGRMAVVQALRRHGIGGRLLSFLEGQARARGAVGITLHAQYYVREFYARHGYREEGEPFMEAGILHIQMSKALGKVRSRGRLPPL